MINKAKQIWITGKNDFNTWMCFRKEFEYYPGEELQVTAEIAVDSKYWLYLNGKLVVREGGLKRGPSRNGTYYDEVDLSAHLASGKNIIAILVWHFGKNAFHIYPVVWEGLDVPLPYRRASFIRMNPGE